MSDLDDIAALVYGSPAPVKASEAVEGQDRSQALAQAVAALRVSIAVIKEGIATGNLSMAAEAYYELTDAEIQSIWVAPTRNENGKRVVNEHAPFTTHERAVIKSNEFRKAWFGDDSGE